MCYDKNDGMYYFTKFVIGDLKDLGYPMPFRFNTLMKEWYELVKKNDYLAIECGRGHGKSFYFSILLNIYDLFLFKNKRVLIESASDEQAESILEDFRKIVDNNEWLSTKKDSSTWRAGKLGFNSGYIMGKGFGSEILGLHLDRIVVDDILRSDNKLSDYEIEDFLDMVLGPMLLNRKGQMILVGTPKSPTDIFSTIENRIKSLESSGEKCIWVLKKYPAIIDYEKKILLCPYRFTWDELMMKRLSMGAQKFAREYQLEIFSRDASLFPSKIIDPAKEKGKDKVLLSKLDSRPSNWTYVMGVDVARSGSASADYTVAIVLAYNSVSQEKQIVHFWRSKGLKITLQAEEIARIAKKFDNCYVLVERNNMGQDMIDELADVHNVNVDTFLTGGVEQKKDELIRFLISSFEHEQIIIPRGDQESCQAMDILESELSRFCVFHTPAGNEQFKGVGSDDCVLSLAFANRATQTVGIPFAVSSFTGRGGVNVYDAFTKTGSKHESDLMNLIRAGIIK